MTTAWVRATRTVGWGSDAQLALPTLPPKPRNRLETIEDLLDQSRRSAVPIRHSFVQQGRGTSTRPGPLANFVAGSDARGLEAYLLLHAVASADPWDCTYPSYTWVRALGIEQTAGKRSSRAAVSKTMHRLAARHLVAMSRQGRLAKVTLLDESGDGSSYVRPTTRDDRWFQLPFEYWSQRHFQKLDLPAKAVLLIALSLPRQFILPFDRVPKWYGIAPKTAQRGVHKLMDRGLLQRATTYEPEVRSETGWVVRHRYELQGIFAKPTAE